MILKILQALISLPSIMKYLKQLFGWISVQMDKGRDKRIDEAAIKLEKAKTEKEKDEALKEWNDS